MRLLLPKINRPMNEATVPSEVYVFRGTSEYPLFDYPLRELFNDLISPENLILALASVLLEYQVLVISEDYYRMMLVSESLTSLIQPFKWQHVYVPILPSKLGLNYLDAPTPYIMGIGADPASFSSLNSLPVCDTFQCRIYCDENRVEHVSPDPEELDTSRLLPPFLKQLSEAIKIILKSNNKLTSHNSNILNKSAALERVVQITQKYKVLDNGFSYLDDLKLNQSIRIACAESIKIHILNDFEKFIIKNQPFKKYSVKFDSASYLSDQSEAVKPFLQKFFETQMFASFLDETCDKIKKNKGLTSSTDSESSLQLPSSSPFALSDPSELRFVPQKCREILQTVDQVFQEAFEDATLVDLNEKNIANSCSSPRRQRKVYDLNYKLFVRGTSASSQSASSVVPLVSKLLSSPARFISGLTAPDYEERVSSSSTSSQVAKSPKFPRHEKAPLTPFSSPLRKINLKQMMMFPNIPGLMKNSRTHLPPDILKFNSFADYHKHMHHEVKKALKQAKEMAKMQAQLENSQGKSGLILGLETRPRIKCDLQEVQTMSSPFLRILRKQMIEKTREMNGILIKLLEERDELLMSQDSLLMDIEDLTRRLT